MAFIKQHVERLRHENATLHSGTLPPSGQDCELQVVYLRLSEAEHGWHYARQQLDAARAMVDERTHAIIHLEHHLEQQDLDLECTHAIIHLEHHSQAAASCASALGATRAHSTCSSR
jgi:hypothetical protein